MSQLEGIFRVFPTEERLHLAILSNLDSIRFVSDPKASEFFFTDDAGRDGFRLVRFALVQADGGLLVPPSSDEDFNHGRGHHSTAKQSDVSVIATLDVKSYERLLPAAL